MAIISIKTAMDPMMDTAEVAEEPDESQEETSEQDGETTVGSWEDLPGETKSGS